MVLSLCVAMSCISYTVGVASHSSETFGWKFRSRIPPQQPAGALKLVDAVRPNNQPLTSFAMPMSQIVISARDCSSSNEQLIYVKIPSAIIIHSMRFEVKLDQALPSFLAFSVFSTST